MLTIRLAPVFATVALVASLLASAVQAQEITSEGQCLSAIKDTEEAIQDNPKLGDKSEKILLEYMGLAKQRCQEKDFKHAGELLAIARGMVASE